MSKVALSGNVLGTGTITLAAPNTNSTVTLNLPDTAGTVLIQDGANTTTVTNLAYTGTLTGGTGVVNIGSGQLVKDASGNVGVGTASPSGKFNVAGGRAFFGGNSEQYSIGVGYNQTRVSTGAQVYYIGATDSATPALVFSEAGGNERMRIEAGGNVGIGTSSPETKLHVVGGAIRLEESGTGLVGLTIKRSAGTVTDWFTYIPSGSTDLRWFNGSDLMTLTASGNVGIGTSSPSQKLSVIGNGFFDGANVSVIARNGDATNAQQIRMRMSGTDGVLDVTRAAGTAPNLIFGTEGSEKARIDSSGNLLVGTTTQRGRFTTEVSSGNARAVNILTGANTMDHFFFNGSSIGTITTNGVSTAYNTTSDYRLKENVAPMTGALEKVAALKPVTYTWKSNGSAGQGFIAHELQEVVPDCVTGEKDAVDAEGNPKYQGVDTSFLVATLVSAIQELTARLEVLENK
jgi:hypothetical protein